MGLFLDKSADRLIAGEQPKSNIAGVALIGTNGVSQRLQGESNQLKYVRKVDSANDETNWPQTMIA